MEGGLNVYFAGVVEIDAKTTVIQRMVTSPATIRSDNGIGRTGIYIEGMLNNGEVSRFAIQINSQLKGE